MQIDRLPRPFLEEMRTLLDEVEYEAFLASMDEVPLSGLRVNRLKVSTEKLTETFGALQPVPWTENGFYCEPGGEYTSHPYYYAGLYYMQEPSAMSSAALLGTKPGERILDLCAAPGGKSTQIADDLQGEGFLLSNDLSASRARALLKNIELMGIGNCCISCEDSGRLKNEYPLFFDRILVDAPCSGEGMFRKHPAVIKAWLEHGKDFYCPVQSKLLDDAADMLRPGGTLLYSTCTYNRNENENQIAAFLDRHPDFSVDSIPATHGLTASAFLPGTVRLFPHKARAEGHFVARLKKSGEAQNIVTAHTAFPGKKETQLLRQLQPTLDEFFSASARKPDPSRLKLQGDYILQLPEATVLRAPLRYLRTGLLLGQISHGRFKPSQALAMYLRAEDFENPISYSADDPAVCRYLRGETLEATDSGSGFRLFCVDGYPLGFIKQDKQRYKNLYLPGWRMQR